MSDKPFPLPGTVWVWHGNEQAPTATGPHRVESLRWFAGGAEAVFAADSRYPGYSCAGVSHMMSLAAWECVPMVHALTPSEVALAKILAAVEEYDATAAPWRNLDASVFAGLDYAADGLCVVGLRAASYLTPQGRALLDRARRAGVL